MHIGDFDTLENVVQIPEIALVSFTGSTLGGIRIREATAKRIVPLNLELGGKDPAYVRADADIKYVAEQIVDGAVFNSGQSCCSVERVYVQDHVHDEFVREVQAVLKSYVSLLPFFFLFRLSISPAELIRVQIQPRKSLQQNYYRRTSHFHSSQDAHPSTRRGCHLQGRCGHNAYIYKCKLCPPSIRRELRCTHCPGERQSQHARHERRDVRARDSDHESVRRRGSGSAHE